MYSLEEIEWAWEQAGISGDWFDFVGHLGTDASRLSLSKKPDLLVDMGIGKCPPPPTLQDAKEESQETKEYAVMKFRWQAAEDLKRTIGELANRILSSKATLDNIDADIVGSYTAMVRRVSELEKAIVAQDTKKNAEMESFAEDIKMALANAGY